jgi:hypothetical protein
MDLTPQERELRDSRLANKEHIGAIMRDFCRHQGFKILQDEIQAKIEDKRNAWLKATNAVEAEALRLQAQPWNEIMELLKKKIVEGDAANLARRSEQEQI